jgi:hypothetical protein
VRFEVLTVASVKMAVFWVVVPCSLVNVYHVSEMLAASIMSHITLMMEAAKHL